MRNLKLKSWKVFIHWTHFNTPCNAYVQFDWGISKMVGPTKQDFWPRINILDWYSKKRLQNVEREKQGAINTLFSKTMYSHDHFWRTDIHRRDLSLLFLLSAYVDFWPKFLLFNIHHPWNSTIELILMYINSNLHRKLTLLFDKGEIASLTQKNFFFPLCNKQVTLFMRKIKEKSKVI